MVLHQNTGTSGANGDYRIALHDIRRSTDADHAPRVSPSPNPRSPPTNQPPSAHAGHQRLNQDDAQAQRLLGTITPQGVGDATLHGSEGGSQMEQVQAAFPQPPHLRTQPAQDGSRSSSPDLLPSPSPASVPNVQRAQAGSRQQSPSRTSDAGSTVTISKEDLEPDSRLRKYKAAKSFLLKLGTALIAFGLPSMRVEKNLWAAAKALGLKASICAMPSSLHICFEHPSGINDTVFVPAAFGLDLGRLYITNGLCRKVATQQVSLDEASVELGGIMNTGCLFPLWVLVLGGFGLGGLSGTVVAFNGGWADVIAALVLGVLVGFIHIWIGPSRIGYLVEFASAFLASFMALVIRQWIAPALCFQATVLAAIIVPLPGLWITISFLEISSKQVVSGTARMWWALTIALQLAFGISVGFKLFEAIIGNSDHAASVASLQCQGGLNPLWNILMVPGLAVALCILFNAHLYQWFPMVVSVCVSFLFYLLCTEWLKASVEVTSLIVAFIMGVAANLWARFRGGGSIEVTLCGIILLVPGSVATRYTVALVDPLVSGAISPGTSVALRFVSVSLAISLGLLAANVVDILDFSIVPKPQDAEPVTHHVL